MRSVEGKAPLSSCRGLAGCPERHPAVQAFTRQRFGTADRAKVDEPSCRRKLVILPPSGGLQRHEEGGCLTKERAFQSPRQAFKRAHAANLRGPIARYHYGRSAVATDHPRAAFEPHEAGDGTDAFYGYGARPLPVPLFRALMAHQFVDLFG